MNSKFTTAETFKKASAGLGNLSDDPLVKAQLNTVSKLFEIIEQMLKQQKESFEEMIESITGKPFNPEDTLDVLNDGNLPEFNVENMPSEMSQLFEGMNYQDIQSLANGPMGDIVSSMGDKVSEMVNEVSQSVENVAEMAMA